MTDVDKKALQLALERCDAESAVHAKLETEDWQEAAEFAAYCCQIAALHLKPWQEPPCVVDEDDPHERAPDAQALLRRMLAAGVSRYHPDPLAAIEAAR